MRWIAKKTTPAPDPEEGGAIVFVLVIATVALFVAAMSVSTGLGSRRASANAMHARAAFFCAEAALAEGRVVVAQNIDNIDSALADPPVSLPWYPVTGACSGTGASSYTYRVTVHDNADDADPETDLDGQVILNAEVLHAGDPVARVSGIMTATSSSQKMLGDYAKQDRSGAFNVGNVGRP